MTDLCVRIIPLQNVPDCTPVGWGGRRDLNPRHSVPQTDALPAELLPPLKLSLSRPQRPQKASAAVSLRCNLRNAGLRSTFGPTGTC
jgi:hypothetical protein